MAFPNDQLPYRESGARAYIEANKAGILLERTEAAYYLRGTFPQADVSALVSQEDIAALEKMFEEAKQKDSFWRVSLDYGFRLFILKAPRLVLDETGFHWAAKEKPTSTIKEMPTERSF